MSTTLCNSNTFSYRTGYSPHFPAFGIDESTVGSKRIYFVNQQFNYARVVCHFVNDIFMRFFDVMRIPTKIYDEAVPLSFQHCTKWSVVDRTYQTKQSIKYKPFRYIAPHMKLASRLQYVQLFFLSSNLCIYITVSVSRSISSHP